MTQHLKYPIGIQTFEKIRNGNFVYVDKTEFIHKLVENSGLYYFLSRPRRFGKSLLLSTIEAFFLGKRELFKGLAIDNYDYDWEEYPVFHIDFTGRDYNDPDSLEQNLRETLDQWEAIYNCPVSSANISERFRNVILSANKQTGRQVVILIDEYDKPLLETVDNPELQTQFRNTLRGFYGNLKRMDQYIKFAMLTGIARFGHLSIFSDLNNLNDISMNKEFGAICGITTDELVKNLQLGVEDFAKDSGLSVAEIYDNLRKNYDGYHFSPENCPDIYNPFSVLNALYAKDINDYWFKTGTPTFLIKMIKAGNIRLQTLSDIELLRTDVENVSFDFGDSLYPILYQSGYLTIKDYDRFTRTLRLGFPNREVEEGFYRQLLKIYSGQANDNLTFSIVKFYNDVRQGNAEEFMQRLQSFFADMDYDSFTMLKLEQHYQNITFVLFKLLGYYTSIEYKTASGRIDMIIKTSKYIYVFEFKMNKTAKEALDQIATKQYLLPFKAEGRRIIKIGANFSSEIRTLNEWIIEEA